MHGTWIQLFFLEVDPADRLIEECDANYREAGDGIGLEGRSSGSGSETRRRLGGVGGGAGTGVGIE